MEESFTDVDDWRSIIDLSEDELAQIFKDEEDSFFKKVENFKLDLDSDTSGPDLRGKIFVTEHLVRRLFPVFAKTKSQSHSQIVRLLVLVLTSIKKLLEQVLLSLVNGQAAGAIAVSIEFNKANLQIGMVLVDLTRDTIEWKLDSIPSKASISKTLVEHIPTVLEAALVHCQNSPRIYQDSYASISEDLKMLFLKSKATLTSFVDFVDSVQEQLFSIELCKLMRDLDGLQPVLLDLDFFAFGLVCKTFVRICKSRWNELWEFRYDALPHLVFVCKSTEKSVRDLKNFLANFDDSGLKRQTNILAFLLKTVRQQSKVIEDSLSDKTLYYQVLFSLMSTLSTLDDISTISPTTPHQSTNFPPKLMTEIPNLIFTFGVQLASEPDFAHFVLNRLNPDLFGISQGGAIYLAKIISWVWSHKDVDLSKIWFLDEAKNLFRALVICLSYSNQDLCKSPLLPGVQYSGKPLTAFSTYEFVVTRTQSFIAGLKPELLEFVESTLLETVLCEIAESPFFWSGQFCLDVWAFLARYGPRQLCLNHVQLLMDIYKSVLSKSGRPKFLELAIRRLFAFLCPEDMLNIQRNYSLSRDQENLHIWKLISGAVLSTSKINVSDQHFVSVSFLEELINGNFDPGQINICSASIQILSEQFEILEIDQQDRVVSLVSAFWNKLDQFGETELLSKDWFVKLLDPLFRLSEKIGLAHISLRSIVNFAQNSEALYLAEKTACLLMSCSDEIPSDEMCVLFTLLTGKQDLKSQEVSLILSNLGHALSLSPMKHRDAVSNDDSYLKKLNFHNTSRCSRVAANKINSRRLVKKRKLIELETDSTSPGGDSLQLALQSIKYQIQSRNVSPASRLSCLSAVQTLENFLNSNK